MPQQWVKHLFNPSRRPWMGKVHMGESVWTRALGLNSSEQENGRAWRGWCCKKTLTLPTAAAANSGTGRARGRVHHWQGQSRRSITWLKQIWLIWSFGWTSTCPFIKKPRLEEAAPWSCWLMSARQLVGLWGNFVRVHKGRNKTWKLSSYPRASWHVNWTWDFQVGGVSC